MAGETPQDRQQVRGDARAEQPLRLAGAVDQVEVGERCEERDVLEDVILLPASRDDRRR